MFSPFNPHLHRLFYSLCKINESDIILVAGAGNGEEAIILSEVFNATTIGVDINIDNSLKIKSDKVVFKKQDLSAMTFRDDYFSLIYCNHVLEHVVNPLIVLRELSRVLKKNSVLFIGFPNRNRLIGYLGSSQKMLWTDLIKWNMNDYYYRGIGKFRNEYGAHAGFSNSEFIDLARDLFSEIVNIGHQYMILKYHKYNSLLNIFNTMGITRVLYPSNYYICIK